MKTILLIEDDAIAREGTAEILRLAGYAVVTAENGIMGVERAREIHPDLVLCDISLPLLDGYGVLYSFRQSSQLMSVPFIFLTAKASRADVRRGMELGADDYLSKPFENSELLSTIVGRFTRFQQLHPDYEVQHSDAAALSVLHENSLLTLAANRKPHLIPRRQTIYAEGEEAVRLYFVQSGRVKIVKTAESGKELITGFYQKGDFFGYRALLERSLHYDSAVAVEDTTLLYIPAHDFAQLLHNPVVSQQFVRLLANRKRLREQQLLDMAYNSVRRRVANALLNLCSPSDQNAANETLIQLSRDDLAAVIGIATESLSRTLSEFRQDGLIEITHKGIKLLEVEKLRKTDW